MYWVGKNSEYAIIKEKNCILEKFLFNKNTKFVQIIEWDLLINKFNDKDFLYLEIELLTIWNK